MTPLLDHAAWTLAAAHAIAFAYELWRATAKAGTSRHDSMKVFVQQGLVTYAVAAGVIAALFAGFAWAAWLGLAFAVAIILVSIFYYNPTIMLERQPGLIDWTEDIAFTGLHFVAAAQLIYALGMGG